MPNFFRTATGRECKAGQAFPLTLPDGTLLEGTWAGSAQNEKLSWWLQKSGHQLAESGEISAFACKAEDDGELIWGPAPDGARLFFVLEPQPPGKSYRLAKMVTTAATPGQLAYFRHSRAPLLGRFGPDGTVEESAPGPLPDRPSPPPKAQGELF